MKNLEPYNKILICDKYTIDQIIYLVDKTLQVKFIDTTLNRIKEPKIELLFKNVYSHKFSDENGMLETFSKIGKEKLRSNNILVKTEEILNTQYFHFMIIDNVDTIIEVITKAEPNIIIS